MSISTRLKNLEKLGMIEKKTVITVNEMTISLRISELRCAIMNKSKNPAE